MSLYPVILILGYVLMCATAFPKPDPVYHSYDSVKVIKPVYRPTVDRPKLEQPVYYPNNPPKFIRTRRFTDGNQKFEVPNPQQKNVPTWEVKPDLSRDQNGNTKGKIDIQNHGKNHDFEAGWGQTIRGPGKHSETWHAGGSVRW